MKTREFVVPDDIRHFIVTSISSIPYLEAMLLFRNFPNRDWNAPEVAERLYMSAAATSELLFQLHNARIIAASERNASYQYKPDLKKTSDLIDRLAAIYSSHLVPITHLIHATTNAQKRFLDEGLRRRREEDSLLK